MSKEIIKISWFGRCCFLLEINDKKILFDPYDSYCNVEIGKIDADILISSSTWHDHGHIGASPKAHIITYPGKYQKDGFIVTGIEALENRGSPTVIFNLSFGLFSITNFADFGPEQKESFDSHVSEEDLKIIKSTNIALVRPSIKNGLQKENIHDENFLDYCQPSVIIPEHYFPETFIKEQVEDNEKDNFRSPNIIVEEMINNIGYKIERVDSYQKELTEQDMKDRKLLKFLKLHPQVKYLSDT